MYQKHLDHNLTNQTEFGVYFKLIYNRCMKKLFLLLILSFFSAQSFPGGCPDGSEPVKSVSADGTYFVYNCGGQASSSSGNSGIKAVAGIDIENDPNIDFFKPPKKTISNR